MMDVSSLPGQLGDAGWEYLENSRVRGFKALWEDDPFWISAVEKGRDDLLWISAVEKGLDVAFWESPEDEKKADICSRRNVEDEKKLEVMYGLVDKTIKQWGSIPMRGLDQMAITSKLKPYCLQVLLDMASRLIKTSRKLEIFPVKHRPDFGSIIQETAGDDDHLTQVQPKGHDSLATAGNLTIFGDKRGPDVGSSAFNGRTSGGELSSPYACIDDLHTQGHDSAAATAVTFERPSPAFDNKSSVADQKPYQKSEIVLTTASKPHGKQSFQDSGGEDHIIQVDHQSHDSVTFGSMSGSNSSSAVADQKPYKNAAIFLDKYGPGVGSSAFRSQRSGGEQSSPGGAGEDRIIQVRDSAATAGSPELATPALSSTPSASDHVVRASAPRQNRDNDEQPPPDRSASDIERGVVSPAERLISPSSVAKACLFVSCEVCLAPSQIRNNAGTSLSHNACILLLFAEFFGVAGLLLCFGAYWFQRKRKTSGVITVMGCVATICGLLSILGTKFPEKAMLWLTAVLYGLPIAASPFALMELLKSV